MDQTYFNGKLWDKALQKVTLLGNDKTGNRTTQTIVDADAQKKTSDFVVVNVRSSAGNLLAVPIRIRFDKKQASLKGKFSSVEILRLLLIQISVPLIYFLLRLGLVAGLGYCTLGSNVEDAVEISAIGFLGLTTIVCCLAYKRAGAKRLSQWIKLACQIIQFLSFVLAMKLTWDGAYGDDYDLPYAKTCISRPIAKIIQVTVTLLVFYHGLIGVVFIILTTI